MRNLQSRQIKTNRAADWKPVIRIGVILFLTIISLAPDLSAASAFAPGAKSDTDPDFLSSWLDNVTKTQETQPHWQPLLNMNSPRLTQGFRYNYNQQYLPNGSTVTNYGMGKGLELILGENFEAQIGIPAYIDKQAATGNLSGWADETLLGRYRLLTANEENGNYVVSASLGLSIPTGSGPFSSHATVFAPALAAGKGWGTRQYGISIQSSLTASLPDNNLAVIGAPVAWSTALQAHVLQYLWPEIEASYTHWYKGPYDGKNQLVLTYGMVFGKFKIKNREQLSFAIGYQEPRGTSFSTFSCGWISMLKLSF